LGSGTHTSCGHCTLGQVMATSDLVGIEFSREQLSISEKPCNYTDLTDLQVSRSCIITKPCVFFSAAPMIARISSEAATTIADGAATVFRQMSCFQGDNHYFSPPNGVFSLHAWPLLCYDCFRSVSIVTPESWTCRTDVQAKQGKQYRVSARPRNLCAADRQPCLSVHNLGIMRLFWRTVA
jgi:hypothetical protein